MCVCQLPDVKCSRQTPWSSVCARSRSHSECRIKYGYLFNETMQIIKIVKWKRQQLMLRKSVCHTRTNGSRYSAHTHTLSAKSLEMKLLQTEKDRISFVFVPRSVRFANRMRIRNMARKCTLCIRTCTARQRTGGAGRKREREKKR